MLQQTQAQRVASLLPVFLNQYPTIHHLATASNASVILAWKGLGYNNRALRLRDAARAIVETNGGEIPDDPAVLRTLPGIGVYTANSIACFAYDKRTLVVDVNVRRVYSRWQTRRMHAADLASDAHVLELAEQLVPKRNPAEWHHAVMDLGATICKAREAQCTLCPVRTVCASVNLAKAPLQPKQSREPMLRGEPRRLWRGRLIQRLREANGRGLSLSELLPTDALNGTEAPQWHDLLAALERDGLVRLGRRITLCDE